MTNDIDNADDSTKGVKRAESNRTLVRAFLRERNQHIIEMLMCHKSVNQQFYDLVKSAPESMFQQREGRRPIFGQEYAFLRTFPTALARRVFDMIPTPLFSMSLGAAHTASQMTVEEQMVQLRIQKDCLIKEALLSYDFVKKSKSTWALHWLPTDTVKAFASDDLSSHRCLNMAGNIELNQISMPDDVRKLLSKAGRIDFATLAEKMDKTEFEHMVLAFSLNNMEQCLSTDRYSNSRSTPEKYRPETMAYAMVATGFPVNEIVKITGLSQYKIREMHKNMSPKERARGRYSEEIRIDDLTLLQRIIVSAIINIAKSATKRRLRDEHHTHPEFKLKMWIQSLIEAYMLYASVFHDHLEEVWVPLCDIYILLKNEDFEVESIATSHCPHCSVSYVEPEFVDPLENDQCHVCQSLHSFKGFYRKKFNRLQDATVKTNREKALKKKSSPTTEEAITPPVLHANYNIPWVAEILRSEGWTGESGAEGMPLISEIPPQSAIYQTFSREQPLSSSFSVPVSGVILQ